MLPLLRVQGLNVSLPGPRGALVTPVDGVSFDINRGECVGLVGESGCGKSMTALSLIGLTRHIPRIRIGGSACYSDDGRTSIDLPGLSEFQLSDIRGGRISMVFQDPLSALNPLMKIGYQIREVLYKHHRMSGRRATDRALELLELTGIPQPEERIHQYPHQLSGGLRQRVVMAIALAGEPRLLIADEPTTALDVTVQAQILGELKRLRESSAMSILFITHDLGVVAQLCDRVMVMYAGRIVERSPVEVFFKTPKHPYSQGLLSSLPSVAGGQERLSCIPGSPPQPGAFPEGCRFHPRCSLATEKCRNDYPRSFGKPGEEVSCWEHKQAAGMYNGDPTGAAMTGGQDGQGTNGQ